MMDTTTLIIIIAVSPATLISILVLNRVGLLDKFASKKNGNGYALKTEMTALEEKFNHNFSEVKKDVSEIKEAVVGIKTDIGWIKQTLNK